MWVCKENFASTGIRFPERAARSESLYRLSYPSLLYEDGLKVFVMFLRKTLTRLEGSKEERYKSGIA
jgi:hypothetical protein